MSKPKAVVLLSGGLDSSTVLAIAQDQGFDAYALSFKYGQRHAIELDAARRIAQRAGVREHVEAAIDLRMFGGSALTSDVEVPKVALATKRWATGSPSRTSRLATRCSSRSALAWAEVLEADDVFIGVNAVDYSGYPDCRPEYIEAYQQMANLATRRGVEGQQLTIHTPLIDLTKAQIIQRGLDLGVDYGLTLSCYDPSDAGEACGECDSCVLRLRGFAAERRRRPRSVHSEGTSSVTTLVATARAGAASGVRSHPGHRDLRSDDPGRGRGGGAADALRPLRRLRLPLLVVRHHVRRRSGGRPGDGRAPVRRRDRRPARANSADRRGG